MITRVTIKREVNEVTVVAASSQVIVRRTQR